VLTRSKVTKERHGDKLRVHSNPGFSWKDFDTGVKSGAQMELASSLVPLPIENEGADLLWEVDCLERPDGMSYLPGPRFFPSPPILDSVFLVFPNVTLYPLVGSLGW